MCILMHTIAQSFKEKKKEEFGGRGHQKSVEARSGQKGAKSYSRNPEFGS